MEIAPLERQCLARGWERVEVEAAGHPRVLLWAGPRAPWTQGAVRVFHGGGGQHYHWCVANAEIVAPQVRFTERAAARGFAVFLLQSGDWVTDREGRLCGKVWDDEVRRRPNHDLPFGETVIRTLLPRLRPALWVLTAGILGTAVYLERRRRRGPEGPGGPAPAALPPGPPDPAA